VTKAIVALRFEHAYGNALFDTHRLAPTIFDKATAPRDRSRRDLQHRAPKATNAWHAPAPHREPFRKYHHSRISVTKMDCHRQAIEFKWYFYPSPDSTNRIKGKNRNSMKSP
jgi:hypothetical protein